ncbi:MAG TPA: Kazal-type serine protease inhibitor [Spirochaetia bacterium]|nr:Kazal-type serine protease inhibitor [Spirochaetia bacterium]
MKNLNSEETLWVILPILLVVGILIASIIILPQTQIENRSKASEPTAVPTKVVLPTVTPTITGPEVICSSLYSPVCSQNGVTYLSECEANQAGVTVFTKGECPKTKATPTQIPTPTPKVLLPESN